MLSLPRIIAFSGVILLAIGSTACTTRSCAHVQNDSAVTVTDVHVTCRGFVARIPSLGPGEAKIVDLKPPGESDITVSFSAEGRRVATVPEGYIEPHGYSANIRIQRDLSVVVAVDHP